MSEQEPEKDRRRDFGRIFKSPRSRFWYVRYRVNGREHVESSGSTDRRKAEKLLARRQAELGLGVFVAPDTRRTTFEDLCAGVREEYARERRKSAATLEGHLKRLGLTFGGMRVVAITLQRLDAYIQARRQDGVSDATIGHELSTLRHAMRLAQGAGKLGAVPKFPKLGAANVRRGFFEPADFAALLAELPEPLRAPAEFAALTGWRKGEVLGLTWDLVDWDAGVVRLEVGTTKNDAGRTFPFGVLPRLQALLEEQRTKTRAVERRTGTICRWVFHRTGAEIKDMFESWNRAVVRASTNAQGLVIRPRLVGAIFHDLRRTAVRNLIRAGVPEHTAMKLSGHKTRDVFDRYDIVSEKDLAEAVTKLSAYHDRQAVAGARFSWKPGDLQPGGRS